MADQGRQVRLLVKMKPGAPGASLQIYQAKGQFKAEPLFKSIGRRRGRMGAAPAAAWYVLQPAPGEGLTTFDVAILGIFVISCSRARRSVERSAACSRRVNAARDHLQVETTA